MILFYGDPHGGFQPLIDAVRHLQPVAVVILGDLQPRCELDQVLATIQSQTDLWFIHGNHDTDSPTDHDHLFGSGLADRNLHGRVAEVAGVRVAGLGGVFRGKVWAPPAAWLHESPEDFVARCPKQHRWRGGLPLRHRSTIFPCDYLELVGQRADVLVTHEAPACHPHGFSAIDELAASLGVRRIFHGHHHLDYRAELEHFTVMGVGLRGITSLDGEIIRPGEGDRSARLEAVSERRTWLQEHS